jgi:hypothetical protein
MHCNAFRHTTNPTPSDSVIQVSAVPGLSHAISRRGKDWSVQLKMDMSIKIQCNNVTKKSLQHLPLVPYCTKWRNKRLYSFLFSPIDCIWTPCHHTQIRQHYHDTHTSLWNWNLNKLWGYTMTCTASSKFCSTGSPLTTRAIWKESTKWKLDWKINK